MEQRVGNIVIEGAKLVFRNFQGKVSDYNRNGEKTCGVLLPDDVAEQAKADGWKVKYFRPKEDDPTGYQQPWLPTKLSYKFQPPTVVLITSRGKTLLDEQTVEQLDWVNIQNVDIVIRPYHYPSINGAAPGISAYIKSLYVTIQEDEFADKYADMPNV